jgi:hypothetical protein
MRFLLILILFNIYIFAYSQGASIPDVTLKYRTMDFSESQIEVLILTRGFGGGWTYTAAAEDDRELRSANSKHVKGLAFDIRTKTFVSKSGNLLISKEDMLDRGRKLTESYNMIDTYYEGVFMKVEVENEKIATTYRKHWPSIRVDVNGMVQHVHIHWGDPRIPEEVIEPIVPELGTPEEDTCVSDVPCGPEIIQFTDNKIKIRTRYKSPWKDYLENTVKLTMGSMKEDWKTITKYLDEKYKADESALVRETGYLLIQVLALDEEAYTQLALFEENSDISLISLHELCVKTLGDNRIYSDYKYIK